MRTPPALLALAALLPLGGCISLGPKTPPRLMTLNASTPLPAGTVLTTDDKRAVGVAPITAAAGLMTQRVMVQDGTTQIAYLKNALWTAPPATLFRALLAETITARTGRVVPDPRAMRAAPDTRLSGQLSSFGLDGPGMAVVVTFDATLGHDGSPDIQTRRFTARVPVAAEDEPTVSAALNQAANQVAVEVADWIGR